MSRNGLFVEYCAKDFLDGTQLLDPWEELAYRRICDMIYATNNNLRDEDKKLAWATKTGNRWLKIKGSLLDAGKISIVDGRITNEKCTKTLAKSAKNIAQKSGAGNASAEAHKRLNNNDIDTTAVDASVVTEEPTDTSTNQEPKNPAPTEHNKPSSKVKRATKSLRYFEDDEPLDPDFYGVSVEYPGLDAHTEWEKFRDYHVAKRQGTASIKASARTWCRNATKFSQPRLAVVR